MSDITLDVWMLRKDKTVIRFLPKRWGTIFTSSLFLALLMPSILPAGQAFAQASFTRTVTPKANCANAILRLTETLPKNTQLTLHFAASLTDPQPVDEEALVIEPYVTLSNPIGKLTQGIGPIISIPVKGTIERDWTTSTSSNDEVITACIIALPSNTSAAGKVTITGNVTPAPKDTYIPQGNEIFFGPAQGQPQMTPEQKALHAKNSAVATGTANIASAVPVIGSAVGALWSLYASREAWLSIDPPDSKFRVIAHPILSPTQHITAGKGFTRQEVNALNAADDNLSYVIILEEAIATSIERAQGAHLAGNTKWEVRQMQTARLYAGRAAKLLRKEPRLLGNVRDAFKCSGFHSVLIGGGQSFPQTLTDPSLIHAILGSAQALEQFAAGE
jgi:hypothetical protein